MGELWKTSGVGGEIARRGGLSVETPTIKEDARDGEQLADDQSSSTQRIEVIAAHNTTARLPYPYRSRSDLGLVEVKTEDRLRRV